MSETLFFSFFIINNVRSNKKNMLTHKITGAVKRSTTNDIGLMRRYEYFFENSSLSRYIAYPPNRINTVSAIKNKISAK